MLQDFISIKISTLLYENVHTFKLNSKKIIKKNNNFYLGGLLKINIPID